MMERGCCYRAASNWKPAAPVRGPTGLDHDSDTLMTGATKVLFSDRHCDDDDDDRQDNGSNDEQVALPLP